MFYLFIKNSKTKFVRLMLNKVSKNETKITGPKC